MESCYEYLGCHKTECVMHGMGNAKLCWQVEGTLCSHHGIELVRRVCDKDKEAACARSSCIYYRAAKTRADIRFQYLRLEQS